MRALTVADFIVIMLPPDQIVAHMGYYANYSNSRLQKYSVMCSRISPMAGLRFPCQRFAASSRIAEADA